MVAQKHTTRRDASKQNKKVLRRGDAAVLPSCYFLCVATGICVCVCDRRDATSSVPLSCT